MSDGRLEHRIARQFPDVRILTSPVRLGPGGGRNRCLQSCTSPYAVGFDDDSYPVDVDFFAGVAKLFADYPHAAIFGASIWQRGEAAKPRTGELRRCVSYVGCGYAIRLAAFREIRGYLPRPVPYGMEETDVSLQLYAAGWTIFESGDLRVFHDTTLSHHGSAEITAGIVTNIALFAFLNYPVVLWAWGLLQIANFLGYCIRVGRIKGLMTGLLEIPGDCYRNRRYRRPFGLSTVVRFLRYRRFGIPS